VVNYAYNSFVPVTCSANGKILTITANQNWTSSIYGIYIFPGALVDEYGNTMELAFHSKFSNINKTYEESIPSTGAPKPCVILTFDDMFVSQYSTAMPYLSGKGLNPTFFMNAGIFGSGTMSDNILSEAQVKAMAANGWLIANHTWDHTLLTSLTLQEQIDEITKDRAWLLTNTNGLGAYIFATPGGAANANTITAMANTGIKFCRGNTAFGPIWNPNLDNGTQSTYGLPMQNFDVKDTQTNTAAKMLDLIGQYFANNQSMIIVIHQITDTPQDGSTDISTTEFQALIDGIIANKYTCLNPNQWLAQWDNVAPTISSTDPKNNAVNVAVNKTIKVTFKEDIKAGTNWFELLDSSKKAIPFTASILGKVLTIDPTSNLAESKYNLIIHTGSVTDMVGNPVKLTNFKFSVGTSPTVKSSNPASGATNVARNKVITVTFNENIKAGSNFWIELVSSSGKSVTITKSISGKVLTIKHSALLAANTKYYLKIHTGAVTDLAGNPVKSNTISFTTGKT